MIVGAGVVGRATGGCLAAIGHGVAFHDVDPARLDAAAAAGYPAWSAGQPFDVAVICVDTPTVAGQADVSRVAAACRDLGPALRQASEFSVIAIRSTVPPGTTRSRLIPALEDGSGRRAGADFGVVYWPEFLRHASAASDALDPWVIVLGCDEAESERRVRDVLAPIAARAEEPIPVWVTDFATAEAAKYASNLFNAAKISFTNEIWRACRAIGVDGDRVMSIVADAAEGMWNSRYGIRGGAPYRGGCLPKDAEAFLGFARSLGLDLPLLDAVVRVNDAMADAGGAPPSSPSPSPPPALPPSSGG